MTAALAGRSPLAGMVFALFAVALGTLTATRPMVAAALMGLGAVLAFAFLFPAAHLTLLLFVAALVPFTVQNSYAFGGGAGATGLVLSDVLLLAGLARAGLVLIQRRLDRVEAFAVAATSGFLVILLVQFVHGLQQGNGVGDAGGELRALLGFSVLLLAVPLLGEPGSRTRVLRGLMVAGVALGLVGIAQWILEIPVVSTADFGVREGVGGTTAGRGQVQGGLYVFPVAVILAFAALMSGHVRSRGARVATITVLVLNSVSLLLTFERTFWLVTVLGCAFVVAGSSSGQRVRALAMAPLILVAVLISAAAVSPATLTTARERLLSLGQYQSDSSVRYRLTESREVLDEISKQPAGAGLGASVVWGRPWEGVLPTARSYAHNGYLWLAWKLGLPAAVFVSGLLALAIVRRGRARGTPLFAGVVLGAQAALFALAIASITFPAFNSPVTPTMGLLLAMCALPRRREGRGRERPNHEA